MPLLNLRCPPSISCQKEVYYASLQKYGEKSIATGYVAKDLGG